ncbi:MAG TPA: cytochrome c-type biogenesis CcmF C-terminal domain-containing protein [Acidimicrobiia bacterium]|nr:cytochrome c-type biogenesis CcmF C-terminal domain-containing protein [Acidimicrobiia bacterium]
MLAFVGLAALMTALAGAAWLTVGGAMRALELRRGAASPRDLRVPAALTLGGAISAMAVLELALIFDDFSLAYVAGNHARATPFPYNVASAWSALEGSIVLWGLVLATFTWLAWRDHRRRTDALSAGALAVMGLVGIFFFGLMLTVANPFEVCVEATATRCLVASPLPWSVIQVPADGLGPNPLLQNHILMAVHPPLLYVGYVGLTTPFAYAISALALTQPGPEWLRRTRRWTLVAWSFLTLGILFGGWWAYEVLSWGGYWAWDPVENASLLPWLVATAFVHSSLVQQRRGMLQAWNFILVISAFALTILGTFLTRSGTITSVHSFTQSAIGPVLLAFLVLVMAGSFALFATRSHLVASAPRLDSFASREGSFLANNLLLTVFALVVLVGTVYPLVLEAFTGTQVGVGEPFYNRLTVPLAFALLLLMGLGPVTPWRHASLRLVWSRIRGPLQVALAAGIVTAVVSTRIGWVVAAVVASVFVIGVIVRHLLDLAGRRTRATGRGIITESRSVVMSDPPFWAGQLSHVGVALVALGLAFAANLSTHQTVDLEPGDSFAFAGYDLTYRSPFQRTEPSRRIVGATIVVSRGGEVVTELEPRSNYFGADPTGIPSPAVMSRPSGDLYLTLLRIDQVGIRLQADTSPLIWLVWLGGLVTAAGGFWALQARRASPSRAAVAETTSG